MAVNDHAVNQQHIMCALDGKWYMVGPCFWFAGDD